MIADLTTMDEQLRMVPVDRPALRREVARLLAGEPSIRSLRLAGVGLVALGEYQRAVPLLARALALAESARADGARVAARLNLADAYRYQGRPDVAEPRYRQALAIARARYPQSIDFALQHLGKCLIETGNYVEAVRHLREALALRHAKGDAGLVASTEQALALAARRSAQPGGRAGHAADRAPDRAAGPVTGGG